MWKLRLKEIDQQLAELKLQPGCVCLCVCVCVCVIPEVDDDDIGWSWLYWGKIFKSSLVGGRGGFLEERTSKMTFGQWVGICQVGHGELHFRQRDSREAGKGKAGGRAWSFRWASPEFLLATDTVQSIIPLPWFAEMFVVQKGLVGCVRDAHQDRHQLHLHSLLSVSGSSPLPSSENQGSGDLPTGLWWVLGSHLDLVQVLSNLPLSLHPPSTVSSLPSHSLSREVKKSPLLLSLPVKCSQIWSPKTSPGFSLIHLTDNFEYLVWFGYCSRD